MLFWNMPFCRRKTFTFGTLSICDENMYLYFYSEFRTFNITEYFLIVQLLHLIKLDIWVFLLPLTLTHDRSTGQLYLWKSTSCWSSESAPQRSGLQAGPSTTCWSVSVCCVPDQRSSRRSHHWRQTFSSMDLIKHSERYLSICHRFCKPTKTIFVWWYIPL